MKVHGPGRMLGLGLVLVLVLSGCSAILEGEYASSTPHTASLAWEDGERVTTEVADYASLYEAVCSFVEQGVERGVIRFDAYEGDMEEDLSTACMTVVNETPLGAYSVYYIDHSLNQLVSIFEAEVTIIYRQPRTDARNIRRAPDFEALRRAVGAAMKSGTGKLTLLCDGEVLETDDVTRAVDSIFYDNPREILYYPSFAVERYPKDGDACILDISLSFPYASSTVTERRGEMMAEVERLLTQSGGDTDEERLRKVCRLLSETVTFDRTQAESESFSPWISSYTAYGALVQHRAVGQGYAIALKLLCDSMGVECVVVQGRRNNVSHAWNIVTLPEGCFHVDASQYKYQYTTSEQERETLFLSDAEMEDYRWDSERYPACPKPLREPVEPPDEPVDPPDEPVDPPDEPVDPPDEPVDPPDEPVDPPDEPVDPPDEPVDPPDEPVDPPDEPVDPPDEPVDPPDEPVDPPDEPVDPPDEPVDPPDEPVDPPDKPVDPPNEPVDEPENGGTPLDQLFPRTS